MTKNSEFDLHPDFERLEKPGLRQALDEHVHFRRFTLADLIVIRNTVIASVFAAALIALPQAMNTSNDGYGIRNDPEVKTDRRSKQRRKLPNIKDVKDTKDTLPNVYDI